MHVTTCASSSELRLLQQHGGAWCVASGLGCTQTYNLQTIAKYVPSDVFKNYQAAAERITETQMASKLEQHYKQRVDEEVNRRCMLSEEEKQLSDGAKRIIEEILQLSCPRCGQAFPETLDGDIGFDGCFALSCSRQGCRCEFCAYCLADCGDNAHSHITGGQCLVNTDRELFNTAEVFADCMRQRRRALLKEFLSDKPAEFRILLLIAVARELNDLGLDPQLMLIEMEAAHESRLNKT